MGENCYFGSSGKNAAMKGYDLEMKRLRPYKESPLEMFSYSVRNGEDSYNRDIFMIAISYKQARRTNYN